MFVYMYRCMIISYMYVVFNYTHIFVRMTTSMYILYVGFDYTYIEINAQGIKSFLASHVWFQAAAGTRTYGTAITSQPR